MRAKCYKYQNIDLLFDCWIRVVEVLELKLDLGHS